MCEGPSAISGPIPPDPTLVPEYYKRPSSGKTEPWRSLHVSCVMLDLISRVLTEARGRLEGNARTLLKGPLAPDPGCYSARSTPRPRIGASAAHILERGQRGVVGDLLKLEGVALNPSPAKPSKSRIHLIKIQSNRKTVQYYYNSK